MLVVAAVVWLAGYIMSLKLSAALAAAGCSLVLGVGAANADIITTFDVSADMS
jgi:hypothetical protein